IESQAAAGRVSSWLSGQDLVEVSQVSATGTGPRRVLVVAHASVADEALQSLRERGFVPQEFGRRTGRPGSALQRCEARLTELGKARAERAARARQLSDRLADMRALRDALGLALEKAKGVEKARHSQRSWAFHAWVREKDLKSLGKRLSGLCEVEITRVEPQEEEVPPSPLTEVPVVEPYTMLTDMFGQPTRRDPDPTPILAPFFALFFGICIGDAGYGLFLVLGAAIGMALTMRRGGNPRLFRLLLQGGIASIVVGTFLGGWFGMDYDSLPGLLRAPADLLNSLVPGFTPGEPDQEGFGISRQFLYVTLGLGLLQLTFGVLVNLRKRWRAGDRLGAILEQSGWLLAILGLFPWLFNRYLTVGLLYEPGSALDSVLLLMLGAGACLIFVMGGREASGFGKIGLGAYAAYGIVNLLGDMLSYSRLFALALSSAIIAQVVNQIGGMLAGLGIPVIGFVLAALVIAGGHLFNLFMAVLSGYIHTARLQFVEFFSKFYDGTGLPFVPLSYEPVFVRLGPDGEGTHGEAPGRDGGRPEESIEVKGVTT
ncbi:hypothetical protein JW921_09440, partial [Candidatus Fermentibacterales bacterium]|nr:hypothetical protein [Candidatus Fermentibacterales bacterium]